MCQAITTVHSPSLGAPRKLHGQGALQLQASK
jgi:hypothetical protein